MTQNINDIVLLNKTIHNAVFSHITGVLRRMVSSFNYLELRIETNKEENKSRKLKQNVSLRAVVGGSIFLTGSNSKNSQTMSSLNNEVIGSFQEDGLLLFFIELNNAGLSVESVRIEVGDSENNTIDSIRAKRDISSSSIILSSSFLMVSSLFLIFAAIRFRSKRLELKNLLTLENTEEEANSLPNYEARNKRDAMSRSSKDDTSISQTSDVSSTAEIVSGSNNDKFQSIEISFLRTGENYLKAEDKKRII